VLNPPDLSSLAGRVFSAVLFDLDGTLIDSTGSVDRVWERWAREYGLDQDDFAVEHGVPARAQLAKLVPADRIEEEFQKVERMECEDLDGVIRLPGAIEALGSIPDHRMAIATSGTRPLAEARVGHTGIRPPAVFVTADDTPAGKPDPAPYLRAAELLGHAPDTCLVVEDAPAGLAAGRAAGCTTLALATSHDPAELDADAVVADLAAVRFVVDDEGVRVTPA
jgi:mannitol-1-/sugar-/sorbitol-6-phosphatase